MIENLITSFGSFISSPTDLKDISIVIATILGIPFLVWRYFSIHKTANAQVEQAKIAEQQHITERIAKAFKLIANDDVNDAIGAIYSLERIANDSPRDQRSILQYLSDYVRRKIPNCDNQVQSEGCSEAMEAKILDAEQLQLARNIDAALSVLGKTFVNHKKPKSLFKKIRDIYRDSTHLNKSESAGYRINLSNTNLTGKNLEGYDLSNVDLRHSNLSKANLSSVNLEYADLRGANLNNANLRMANLQGADLKDATCNSTIFINAHLEKANLWNGSFEMAIMIKARLNRAIFINANMNGVNLIDADLQGAIFSEANLKNAQLDPDETHKAVFLGAIWS